MTILISGHDVQLFSQFAVLAVAAASVVSVQSVLFGCRHAAV